jgi:hypothetical protein
MEILKKTGSLLVAVLAISVIGYKFFDGWLINPPKPRVFESEGSLWVAEPSSAFMHYLFGTQIFRAARKNSATGKYEFEKDGQWIPVQ